MKLVFSITNYLDIYQKARMIKEVLLSVLTGAGAGIVFALFRLPVPAPPVFAGVAGIIGLWGGYALVSRFLL
jgi:XapX domain-containing protein